MKNQTVGELISLSIEEKEMKQKELAKELGISPSRVSEFINGKSEPSLRIARTLCTVLGITLATVLGLYLERTLF